jgi:hypothetical protein
MYLFEHPEPDDFHCDSDYYRGPPPDLDNLGANYMASPIS